MFSAWKSVVVPYRVYTKELELGQVKKKKKKNARSIQKIIIRSLISRIGSSSSVDSLIVRIFNSVSVPSSVCQLV